MAGSTHLVLGVFKRIGVINGEGYQDDVGFGVG